MDQTQPLHGVRVVELSSFVAAPLCGQTLAQLGAEVIRIDPPWGAADLHRWPLAPSGTSMYWTGLNRGKRSVAMDLRSEEGRELVRRMLGPEGEPTTGIVVTNGPVGSWLDHAHLSICRSDLIHVHIQGRTDGRPAVDYTINAESGLPLITGRDADPTNHVLPAWDLITGNQAALAVVTALRHRDLTGLGQGVSIALEDVAFAANGALGLLPEVTVSGLEREPIGNDLYGSFGVDFPTADGRHVIVVALTGRQWLDLCGATGTTEILATVADGLGVDLGDEGTRFEHRAVIRALMEPWFRARTSAEIVTALDATSVLVGEFRSVAEAVAHGRKTGSIVEVDQPGIGPVPRGRLPLRFSELQVADHVIAPSLGADTDAVLTASLGLDDADLADLRSRGVIA